MNSTPPWLAEIQFPLLESMAEGVTLNTAEGELVYANSACEQMFAYAQGELLGRRFSALLAGEQVANERAVAVTVANALNNRRWTGEFHVQRKDGSTFYIQARITAVTMGGDEFLLCVLEDITRRKRAEQALRVTEGRLQQVIGSDILGFIVWDADGDIIEANDNFLRIVGYSREDLQAGRLRWNDLTPHEFSSRDEAGLRQLQETGRCEPFEKEYIRKDGTRVPILIGATALEGDSGRGISFILDLSKRKRAEASARAAEQRFQAFMDNSYATAFMKDDAGRYQYINRRFRDVHGAEESQWYGRTDEELWPADIAQQFKENDRRVLEESQPLQLLETTVDRDGSPRYWQVMKFSFVDVSGKRFLGGMALDVTEQLQAQEKLRLAEDQVRQAQKMEAVGRLAGGVAHDFNNLLTIINGCSELLLEQLAAAHPGHHLAREINDAGQRAAGLTRQLLAFSRRQMLQPKVLDVNAVLLHLHKILRRALGPDIEIAMQLASDAGNIRVDPTQLDQAIINLAVNARDAMPQGGRLTLQTHSIRIGADAESVEDDCLPGQYVRICVVDSGHGMDGTTQAHIFEPFFTTKQAGKGTGLGLAMVYGFVRQSGGQITVESKPGEGTRFVIDLPCVLDATVQETAAPDRPALPRGQETVLIVEDEEGVRSWTRHILQSCGYRVLEASHGAQAVAIAHAEPNIDILVTDVIMPKMSGSQVAEALRERFAEIKVLYVSGYTDDAIVRRGIMSATAAFLQKPFTAHALATKVRELLDQAAAGKNGATGKSATSFLTA